MNLKEIAYVINEMAFENERAISKLQKIRYKHLKIRPNTWNIFSERSIKSNENYAFHSGGRKEFQFNIANDWLKGRDVFRYGLAFSLNEDRTLHDAKAEFNPKIERFNHFLSSNPEYFQGFFMWYYSNGEFGELYDHVRLIDEKVFQAENFIFIGKFIDKDIEEIGYDDIQKMLDCFDYMLQVYEEVEFGGTKIEKRIARLTWNKNGWVKPSGPDGKSSDKHTHEGKFGYGHEEWLFDTSKLINGYHYGFLEPVRKQQQAYSNNIYHIWLYTIDNISKKRFWIGEIENVEVISSSEADEIKEIYIQKGWHEQMETQIMECGANADGFSGWQGVDLFNIKFKPENIKFNSEYFELPKDHKIYEQSRYTFANYNEELTPKVIEKGFMFTSDNEEDDRTKENNDPEIESTTYERAPRAIEVKYVHKAISDGLKSQLKLKFGALNVGTEKQAGYGNNKIDLIVRNKNEYIFYEIKAYASSRTSIREAIGQLLEYSCWVNNNTANKLVIVSQKLGDTEDAINYIRHLRSTFQLPVYFQIFDLTTKELSEEY